MTCSVIDMLHVTRSVLVGMKWHTMTFALHLYHGTSRRLGCECMVGVDTVFGVRQYGKSTLCLVFDVCRQNMVNRHCVGVRCMS